MRLRVLDNHVMVGKLLVLRQVKSVQNTFETFAREFRANVRARQFCAKREGMNGHIARAAKFAGDGRDVKCRCRFVLKLDVFDTGIFTRKNFRHGICKISNVARANVTFDDGQLAVRFGDDEIARQNHLAGIFCGRNINQLHRLGDFDTFWHKDKRAVGEECLIQRGERVARRVRVFAEMPFDEGRILRERGGKIFNPRTAGNGLDAGKFRAEKSVHEHETMAGQFGERRVIQHLGFRAVHGNFFCQLEIQFLNRRNIGEAPVLVA